mmetsp:Transcript_49029/g.59152  ORF Transcript_49029/g.59152 Transcript_49029/m.59152 type:complete len:155 (+) Transcript_49029:588-1052(+)
MKNFFDGTKSMSTVALVKHPLLPVLKETPIMLVVLILVKKGNDEVFLRCEDMPFTKEDILISGTKRVTQIIAYLFFPNHYNCFCMYLRDCINSVNMLLDQKFINHLTSLQQHRNITNANCVFIVLFSCLQCMFLCRCHFNILFNEIWQKHILAW